jgi:hypothetical protein
MALCLARRLKVHHNRPGHRSEGQRVQEPLCLMIPPNTPRRDGLSGGKHPDCSAEKLLAKQAKGAKVRHVWD